MFWRVQKIKYNFIQFAQQLNAGDLLIQTDELILSKLFITSKHSFIVWAINAKWSILTCMLIPQIFDMEWL